jgi:hypothetical protein
MKCLCQSDFKGLGDDSLSMQRSPEKFGTGYLTKI